MKVKRRVYDLTIYSQENMRHPQPKEGRGCMLYM